MRPWFSLAFALLLLAGCQVVRLPDPNEPPAGENISADVLHKKLDAAYVSLQYRVAEGQITPPEAERLLLEYIREQVAAIDVEKIPVDQAWNYAEAFKKARDWETAEALFSVAVANAPNEDRRVNDLLRLAHVKAEQGEVEEAVGLARETLDAAPEWSAPILPAVLLEIVPAARRETRDYSEQLADLLLDAAEAHGRTVVDPQSEAGRNFFIARLTHMSRALTLAAQLYERAGNTDKAQEARTRLEALSTNQVQT